MVFDKVKDIILDQIGVAKEKVTMDARFQEDLGADSLDAVELIMNIEDEFKIQIPEEAASEMKTVGDIVKYIEANI